MAGIYSVNMAAVAMVLPFVGRLQDSWGARKLFTVGGITMGIALLASSLINSLWQLYIAYGILTALGIAILSIGLHSAMVSRWFSARGRRGTAIGMALAGTGVGVLVLTPLTDRIITALGWRNAYLTLAALMFLVAVPMNWIFVRDAPETIGLHPDGWTPEPRHTEGKSTAPSRTWACDQISDTRLKSWPNGSPPFR
jgi:MFS family permease